MSDELYMEKEEAKMRLGMEIEEFSKEIKEMELRIHVAVDGIIEDFRKKTGYSPDNVSVYLTEVSTLAEVRPRYIVRDVNVGVKL